MPVSALQNRLRSATKAAHRALDHHPLLAPLLRDGLTQQQYGDALSGLHGAYRAAEASIIAYLHNAPVLLDYQPRRKLHKLDADLQALQRTPSPFAVDQPPLGSVGALIGRLYTLEGSTLGGQAIANHLQRTGMGHLPMQFFGGYGARTQSLWAAFIGFAERHGTPDQWDAAVHFATEQFEAIRAHLDQLQPA